MSAATTVPTVPTASQTVFERDLSRHTTAFERLGAVVDTPDGKFIDQSKAPARLLSSYSTLCRYGYANGLL